MRRKTIMKTLMLLLVIGSVFLLSGCNTEHYTRPIDYVGEETTYADGIFDGVEGYEWTYRNAIRDTDRARLGENGHIRVTLDRGIDALEIEFTRHEFDSYVAIEVLLDDNLVGEMEYDGPVREPDTLTLSGLEISGDVTLRIQRSEGQPLIEAVTWTEYDEDPATHTQTFTDFTDETGDISGFGWVQWIVRQLANLIYNISYALGGMYIVGLLIVTLIIRIVGWPIYSKSTAMSANMQIAQPEIEKLKEKYQDKKDQASQQKMQQEMLQIYRKYNINPVGCLFPFLQMPIFIAMYQVVRRLPLTERYHDLDYRFLWFDFQAEPDGFGLAQNWQFFLLAGIVGVTMFLYQRYAMKRPEYMRNKKYETAQQQQTQKTMKYMMYFMVIMLTAIAFTNLGIAFYWIVGNLFQFVQTRYNRKRMYQKFFANKESA